jgi:acyl-CoA thioester hydrolase
LRELDMTPAQLEKQGIMLPVRNLQSKYYQPALYDELLTVKTTLTDISPLRLNFQFEIFNSKKNLINFGKLQLIFVDEHSRNPRRSNDIAEKLMQKIHQHV